MDAMQTEESFVPLNDVRKLKKSGSLGSNSDLDIDHSGDEGTLEYRMQAKSSGKQISLWHDVSLVHIDPVTKQDTPYLNFVCEIPKFSRCV
jgi:inorganic pyrophosphatase